MIKVVDGDFAAALRAACTGLSGVKRAEALEAEIERVELIMEEMAEDSTQEAAMEGWDLYLCSLQLLEHLVNVIVVDMAVAAGPHEFAGLQARLLGHHKRQQCV